MQVKLCDQCLSCTLRNKNERYINPLTSTFLHLRQGAISDKHFEGLRGPRVSYM